MAEQKPEIETMEQLLAKYGDDLTKLTSLAKTAETSERFEDMSQFMAALVKLKKKQAKEKKEECLLEITERNMLSVAYKNVVGTRRSSWRTFSQDGDAKGQDPESGSLRETYIKIVEKELWDKCREVLDLLESDLLPDSNIIEEMKAEDTCKNHKKEFREGVIFYLKMCGDYYRYLAEFQHDNEDVKTSASDNYDAAIAVASATLAPTHPTHLGLILNASVCKYEILKRPEEARQLAKNGFDSAIQKLDSLSDSTYKDSTLIMQLLRDNLTIWTADPDHQHNDGRED